MFGFGKKPQVVVAPEREPTSYFSTHAPLIGSEVAGQLAGNFLSSLIRQQPSSVDGAMDSDADTFKMMAQMPSMMSARLADWYSSQGFIGWQMCAMLGQNWLINKACTMPARDATRNGFDVVTDDGSKLPDDALKLLKKYDKKYRIRWNSEQFVRMGRMFGIRVAIFQVESTDPYYYEKPFNPDGITKGSYKGIAQVDPYWMSPLLAGDEVSNPASQHFYEPMYWQINGRKYHRSHLVIFRNGELPDILKPMYMYGGLPVPQLIMERVYGAERYILRNASTVRLSRV